MIVDSKGTVKFAGKLGDGTSVSQSALLSIDGQWPFYISLYSGSGSLFGWLTFAVATLGAAGLMTATARGLAAAIPGGVAPLLAAAAAVVAILTLVRVFGRTRGPA